MALGPPVGRLASRIGTVLASLALVTVMTVAGAALAGSTTAVTAGLAVIGFVTGLAPRAGPRWAAMQLPALMAFAYSAAFPLAEASAASRVGAVLAAAPVYLLGVAVLFQPDARRPLLLGAAGAFAGLAGALNHALGGSPQAAREAELAVMKFRLATGRLKDAAVPSGDSPGSRAGRLLTISVQQAVTVTELIAADGGCRDGTRAERAGAMGKTAGSLAAGLAGTAAVPAAQPIEQLARAMRADRDVAGALLADALADAAGLAGLIASLFHLTRIYWAVFAVIVVLNAPAALDWRRALMRIGGTLTGFLVALVLLDLVAGHGTLAFIVAMAALLPAMFLMPVNYGAAVAFITCTVSMMYAVSGEEADFLRYRVADNLVGVAVVCGVGLLLWRTSRADWWRVARLAAGSLANAAASPDPASHRDELLTRAFQLRTETAEEAAVPDAGRDVAAYWTYTAAAEDLIRALAGPPREREAGPASLAAPLRAIEEHCTPAGALAGAWPKAPVPATRAALDVTRMATVITALQQADSTAS